MLVRDLSFSLLLGIGWGTGRGVSLLRSIDLEQVGSCSFQGLVALDEHFDVGVGHQSFQLILTDIELSCCLPHFPT